MEWNVNFEMMFDYCVVMVCGFKEWVVFKVQVELVDVFWVYLCGEGFIEISMFKIVLVGVEGGVNFFFIDYFGYLVYFVQSLQFYKQIMVGVFECVFEVVVVYCVEEYVISCYFNEYLLFDVEMGFIEDEEDVMGFENCLLVSIMEWLWVILQVEFELLGVMIFDVLVYIFCIMLMDVW